jgi:hypothetical protein
MIETQYYLITNIDTVTLTGGTPDVYGSTDVHLHASAILLQRDDRAPRRAAPCQIRLFGPDAAWPITSLAATTIDHEISPLPSIVPGAIQISYALIVDKRWHLKLVTESQDGAPPEVTAYPTGTPIEDIWQDLREKTAAHWHAPNMPMLQWVPVDYARQLRKTQRER